MTYCINPHCPKPVDPVNVNNLICRNCGSEILLQGRYRVIKQLGQGGFGNTFEVDECGKTKVLKVLTEKNPKAIELFQQEAKVLSQLNSAGIPKVEPNGYFTVLPKNSSVPLHCLAMEKIEGVNLEQWMEFRNYQRLSEAQALNWLKQLVEILALVHAHKYFHRDIKPQNIMLRPSGQLVLIDFGAVRQVTTTIVAGNSHTRIFSQGYSPPEQQNGYSVQQSDFFALGRTFIFLLTGKEPQDKEIYDPLTNELHWRKSALNLSPLLADLIDHLMAPTANHRPQNTQVILQKLNEIEKALQMPRILWPQTAIQSINGSKFAASSSSVATVAVGGAKSVNAFFSQTQKSQKLWQVLIVLGLGCFAVVIAAINQQNTKNPVSVSPVENVPVAIPSPVTQIPEIPLTANSQPTISPLNLPTPDKLETEQAQIEAIEKEKYDAVLKAEEERQAAIKKEADTAERERLEAVKSCQKDVLSVDYYNQMDLGTYKINEINDRDRHSSLLIDNCIYSRYHYSLILAKYPWLSSTRPVLPGYPGSALVGLIAQVSDTNKVSREIFFNNHRDRTSFLDCIASQNVSSQECSFTKYNIAYGIPFKDVDWYGSYMINVCPSCVVAHDEISGSKEEMLTAFMKWFLTLDKPHRRELISLLGDDVKAYELKLAIYNQSLAAVQKYHEERTIIEEQQQEQRRQELLGN